MANIPLLEESQQSLSSPPSLDLKEIQVKKWREDMHIPIMSIADKVYVVLMGVIGWLQVICHGSIFYSTNTIQIRQNMDKGLIPLSLVMPRSNFGTISCLKSDMTKILPQTSPNIFLYTHPFNPWTSLKHHLSHELLDLASIMTLHKVSLMHKTTKQLSQESTIEQKYILDPQPFFISWRGNIRLAYQVKFELNNQPTP